MRTSNFDTQHRRQDRSGFGLQLWGSQTSTITWPSPATLLKATACALAVVAPVHLLMLMRQTSGDHRGPLSPNGALQAPQRACNTTALLPAISRLRPHPQPPGLGVDQVRTLVVLFGQPRGGLTSWKSLHKHVLAPLNAHLATYFTDDCPCTELDAMTTYSWSIQAPQDWQVVMEEAARHCLTRQEKNNWQKLYQIKDQFLGGIIGSGQPGSGGIMLAFRWLVQRKIVELNLADKYDYMILSRSDQLHICDHPPLNFTEKNFVHLPFGEEYNGWADRHIFAQTREFMRAINITQSLVCDTDRWISHFNALGRKNINPESIQKVLWQDDGLQVRQFNRSMFSVKTNQDTTTWSPGHDTPITHFLGLKVKYLSELDMVFEQCADPIGLVREEMAIQAYE